MNYKLYNAAKLRYETRAEGARVMLDMLFNDTVMIGEHTDILKEIDKWTTILAEALDSSQALEYYAAQSRKEGSEAP